MSNWRQNVFDAMMWGSDWALAARLLEDPDFLLVARGPFPRPEFSVWYWPDPDQLPAFVGEYLVPGAHPTFPYGYEVEPD